MRHRIGPIVAVLLFVLPGFAAAEDKFFDSNGVQIRYVEEGSGSPVVLVHGNASTIEANWVAPGVFAALAKDHHVIALDNRGHGKSGKPHDAKAYGNEMPEDVVRLMDHLKISRAHIVGYSMGGMIVMKMLTTHPNRFLTATLGGMGLRHRAAADDDKEAAAIEQGDFRALTLRIWPTDQPPPSDDVIRQQSQATLARGNDPMALAQVVRGYRDLAVSDTQMSAVRVPMLAAVGSADPYVTAVKDLKTVVPSLKVTVVEGATHAGDRAAVRRPEFVAAIRDFIDIAGNRASP